MLAVDAGAPELDNIKVAVKSIIATVVVVLVMLNRKKETVKSSSLALIGGVTLLNVILAVFW
jgi:hypothetical protein